MTDEATLVDAERQVGHIADYAWRLPLGAGLVGIVLGVLIVVWPDTSTLVAAVIFGVYLVISGVAQVLLGLFVHLPGAPRALVLVSGVLSVVLGVVCFRDQMQSVVLLAIWVGVGWIMAGFATLTSFTAIGASRVLRAVEGILMVAAGVVLIVSPIESLTALIWLTGILLIAIGVIQVADGVRLRKRIRAAT
ncbi:HdeD family acid-resistance protein [Gordonia sinesedis]